jgi:hypothetical protein
MATGATHGHIKIITDRRGDILGATIVGVAAAENIAIWALAINQKLNIDALAGVIVPYPTYAEVGKRAVMTYFTRVFDQSAGAAHHKLAASFWLINGLIAARLADD